MLFTLEQAKRSLQILDVPINRNNLRKCSRAKWLLDNEHIKFYGVNREYRIYHVTSQWAGTDTDGGVYTIRLNGTEHDCDCPNSLKDDICKHRLACKMLEFKLNHENGHKPKETITFTADRVTGFETKSISIWHKGKYHRVTCGDCQVEGHMVTMPKGIANRLGIDYQFDPDYPLYTEADGFDYATFRHEADSYKLEMLQSMY